MDDTFLAMEVGFSVDAQAIPKNVVEFELWLLGKSLLPECAAFVRLRDRHKANIPQLLRLLARHRIEWLLANETPLFNNWSLEQAEKMPKRLLKLSQTMENAFKFLTDYERLRWHLKHSRSNEETRPDRVQPSRENSQYFVRNIRTDVLEVRLGSLDDLGVAAVTVRLWARHLEGVDWRTLTDRAGRLRFHRRRAKLSVEAKAGHELVAFLRRGTTLPLYDYVGILLAATFPNLRTWQNRGEKRLRDRVKQLLETYPPIGDPQ